MNNFQKIIGDLLAATKKSIVVSAYNCESRDTYLISEAIDSNTTFIMLDAFKRDEYYFNKIPNKSMPTEDKYSASNLIAGFNDWEQKKMN